MSYMQTYKTYRDDLIARGVQHHLAEKLAKDMSLNHGQLSPHMKEYAEAAAPWLIR